MVIFHKVPARLHPTHALEMYFSTILFGALDNDRHIWAMVKHNSNDLKSLSGKDLLQLVNTMQM